MIKLVVKQRFITSQHVKHLEGAIIQVDQAQAKVYLEKGLVEKHLTPEAKEAEAKKVEAEKPKKGKAK